MSATQGMSTIKKLMQKKMMGDSMVSSAGGVRKLSETFGTISTLKSGLLFADNCKIKVIGEFSKEHAIN